MPMDKEAFDGLGMPFPLFKAPVSCATLDEGGECNSCGANSDVRFAGCCYACFRGGAATETKDTELGMVTPELAARGLTHGLPLARPSSLHEYDLVAHPVDPAFPEERWYHVRVPAELLNELLRTPSYHSWQGERWLFCCQQPCVFLGDVEAQLLTNAELSVLLEEPADRVPGLRQAIVQKSVGTYLFQCPHCGRRRAHHDST